MNANLRNDESGFWRRVGIAMLGLLTIGFVTVPAHAVDLYSPQSFRALTADQKAYRVGDALTVQVIETSSSQTSADTRTRRNNDVGAGLSRAHQPATRIGLNTQGDFDGGGSTERSNRLLATLTVTVREVLPNGDLRVAGSQSLTLNDEEQQVELQGRVRVKDISDANVVLSTRLADVRIRYAGEGELSERQKPSWWRRLLNALGF